MENGRTGRFMHNRIFRDSYQINSRIIYEIMIETDMYFLCNKVCAQKVTNLVQLNQI